jgi:hypothetical protein
VYGIEDTARRFGQYRWAELQLFELLGSWATAAGPATDAPAVAMLAAHCHHHAWHADVFAGRTPAVAGPAAAAQAAPLPELVVLLDAARAAQGIAARLHAVYRGVLPALAAEYERHLLVTDPRIDGPTVRALTLVLHDLADDRSEGQEMLQRLSGAGAC